MINYQEYLMPIVVTACLIVGFVLKQSKLDINRYIPAILAILGAIVGCIANKSITLENVVYGALSGLASTGLHQAFKRFVNKGSVN